MFIQQSKVRLPLKSCPSKLWRPRKITRPNYRMATLKKLRLSLKRFKSLPPHVKPREVKLALPSISKRKEYHWTLQKRITQSSQTPFKIKQRTASSRCLVIRLTSHFPKHSKPSTLSLNKSFLMLLLYNPSDSRFNNLAPNLNEQKS